MYRANEKHQLNYNKVGQDEVHLECLTCKYKRAIPLDLKGNFDGKGMCVQDGDEKEHVFRGIIYY